MSSLSGVRLDILDPLVGGPVAHADGPAAQPPTNDYLELKRLIKQQGLLAKQPVYYAAQLLLLLGLSALGVTLVVILDDPWLRILTAAFWAFVFTQIAFIGHDAGHREVFNAAWKNDVLALILINLVLGASRGWWVDKHNRHHGNPNQPGLDPDIDFPVLGFSEEQAQAKLGVSRFIVSYQAFFFFPLLLLEALNMRFHSTRFLVQNRPRYFLAEVLLISLHVALYVGGLVYLLGVWSALLFIVVHHALLGLYLGFSFATNHKGMLMLEENSRMGYLRRQILTARNLNPHPLTDFFFGPLGCQIEHHLFPAMPRNRLRVAEPMVKAFCQQRSIAYHETSLRQAYREILHHLHEVGAPLRKERRWRGR